jgi:hypothetical protein
MGTNSRYSIHAPDLDKNTTPSTPSPSRPPSSSSIDISPPRTIQALEKNQAKLSRLTATIADLTPKQIRNIDRLIEHSRIAAEEGAMFKETINQIRASQAPPTAPIY